MSSQVNFNEMSQQTPQATAWSEHTDAQIDSIGSCCGCGIGRGSSGCGSPHRRLARRSPTRRRCSPPSRASVSCRRAAASAAPSSSSTSGKATRSRSGQAIAAIGDEKLALQMKSLDAQIEALQAQSDQAQIDFDRTEGLVERGMLPRIKLDEARTALNVAENGSAREDCRAGEWSSSSQTEGQVLAPAGGRVLKKPGGGRFGGAARRPHRDGRAAGFQIASAGAGGRHARFLKAGDKIRLDGGEFGEHTSKSGVIELVYPQIEEGRVIADATVEGLGEYFVGDRLRVWISGGTRTAFVIPSSYVTTRFGIDYVHIRQGRPDHRCAGTARARSALSRSSQRP